MVFCQFFKISIFDVRPIFKPNLKKFQFRLIFSCLLFCQNFKFSLLLEISISRFWSKFQFRIFDQFSTKISIFDQNFNFRTKFQFSNKISIFYQNFNLEFSTKISIFEQNFNFRTKFQFSNKISIFEQNFNFLSKFQFSNKILIFQHNFNFQTKCENKPFSTYKFRNLFCRNWTTWKKTSKSRFFYHLFDQKIGNSQNYLKSRIWIWPKYWTWIWQNWFWNFSFD